MTISYDEYQGLLLQVKDLELRLKDTVNDYSKQICQLEKSYTDSEVIKNIREDCRRRINEADQCSSVIVKSRNDQFQIFEEKARFFTKELENYNNNKGFFIEHLIK